ncbi:transmembrane protein 54b isoform X1 [Tachysurus ichikawai]
MKAGHWVSCATLQGPKALMKMGLCMVLVGHLNFLLAALVHGTVLRHIGQNTQTLEYAISNILALTAGLVGILVGILTIILSRNEKNRVLFLSPPGGITSTSCMKFAAGERSVNAEAAHAPNHTTTAASRDNVTLPGSPSLAKCSWAELKAGGSGVKQHGELVFWPKRLAARLLKLKHRKLQQRPNIGTHEPRKQTP